VSCTHTHVRCRVCGAVLPGWRRLPNRPDGALLLHYLANWHMAEPRPLLQRMETEDIGTVAMEAFERVGGHERG
jgi:hypothetical protein